MKPLAVLLAATLAACGGEIVTSPDAVRIEPFWVAQLRAPQSVVLSNGLSNPVKYQIRNESITWELDARQLTDTAIVMLRRALDAQGIRPGAQPDKTAASVDGENGSGFGVQGAFEGAIQSALHRLLIDPRFLAYINR
jgi:hypothetical protein